MVQMTTRIERLVSEAGSCCGGTVEECRQRLGSIETAADSEGASDDVAALSALSNETRYRLVRLLHAAGTELCVCELDALVDASESAISHALRSLRDAGLVETRTEGRWRYYRTTRRATALVVALDGSRPTTDAGPGAE